MSSASILRLAPLRLGARRVHVDTPAAALALAREIAAQLDELDGHAREQFLIEIDLFARALEARTRELEAALAGQGERLQSQGQRLRVHDAYLALSAPSRR